MKLSADAYAAAWVRFAAAGLAAYGIPREYPAMQLDTNTAAKRAALAADELMLEFRSRIGLDGTNPWGWDDAT